jgi:rare lipoprotein A
MTRPCAELRDAVQSAEPVSKRACRFETARSARGLMRTRNLILVALICVAGCATPQLSQSVPAAPAAPAAAQPEKPTFSQTGVASWYGSDHQGKKTADGERYDMHAMTAAQRDLPFNTVARVTSEDTGHAVTVRINDRGPNAKDRIIDLSSAAAAALGMRDNGVMTVRVDVFASDQSP